VPIEYAAMVARTNWGSDMKTLHAIVFGLIAALAGTLFFSAQMADKLPLLADNSMAILMAIGIIGLVGAREKTPNPQA